MGLEDLMSTSSNETQLSKGFFSRNRRALGVLLVVLAVGLGLVFVLRHPTPSIVTLSFQPIVGWGGANLGEVSKTAPGNPASKVFPGQTATDLEYLIQVLASRGLDSVRVSWDPSCSNPPDHVGAPYNASDVSTAIKIASYYNFWIILDNHGYDDPYSASSCWLNFWSGVTGQFKNDYPRIVWEPENEPCYGGSGCDPAYTNNVCSDGSSCVSYLSARYQELIAQTRAQGDTHGIVVESVCSYGCGFCPSGAGDCLNAVNSYPNVTDPAGKIFLSIHSYMSYSYYSSTWNNSTASMVANGFYQTIVAATKQYGWPALNTEGGADPLCTSCAPDTVLNGSAGYSRTTFHFIQALTSLYDSNSPRIGWLWWPAGDWTDTTTSPLGTLDCNSSPKGWGCLLNSLSVSA